MDTIKVFELIPEDEEYENEDYEDPFASEKDEDDSICEEVCKEVCKNSENSQSEDEDGGSVTVHVPMITTEALTLIFGVPSTVSFLLEKLRQDLPVAFDSKDEFIGRIYCDGQLVEEDDGKEIREGTVVVMINDLLLGKGNNLQEEEDESTEKYTEIAESETNGSGELSEPSESSESSELPNETNDQSSQLTQSSTQLSQSAVSAQSIESGKSTKSFMSRFKNLWASEKPAKSHPLSHSVSLTPETVKPTVTVRLECLNKNEDSSLPHFIEDVLEYLDAESQIQEGLFRLSGTFSRIQMLQDRLNNGERLSEMSLTPSDCHNVASLLKQFLRNLPEPLLTFDLYDAWQGLGGWTESRKVSSQISKFLVNRLPPLNKSVLLGLMEFLHRRLKDSEITRMNACNFGTVIGPNLLWHRGEDRQSRNSTTLGLSLQSTTLASQICTHFLLNYEEIFVNSDGDLGVFAYGRALYEYPEISLRDDQIVFITGIEDKYDGWWRGYISYEAKETDKEGVATEDAGIEQKFPSNYVRVVDQESDTQLIERIKAVYK